MKHNIKIYSKEIEAGLSDKIDSGAIASTFGTISFAQMQDCQLARDVVANAVVPYGMGLFTGILVSVGWNKNDDVFSTKETYDAYTTARSKPVSTDHLTSEREDTNTICGYIQDAWPLKTDLTLAESAESFAHILTSMYVWSAYWPTITEGVIEKIDANKQFVSMECLIKDFGYALKDRNGITRLVERNDKTSALTSYLRRYGGPGKVTINGSEYRIGRWLKDIVFSGVSFVDNPANEQSVVFSDYVLASEIQNDNLGDDIISVCIYKEEKIMSKEQADKKVAEADVVIIDKTSEESEPALCPQCQSYASSLAAMQDKVKCAEEAKAASEKALCEAQAALAEASAKVEAMEKAKVVASRMTVAKELALAYDESKIAAMSDETFNTLVEFAKTKPEPKKEEVSVAAIEENKQVGADVIAASIAASTKDDSKSLSSAFTKLYSERKPKK